MGKSGLEALITKGQIVATEVDCQMAEFDFLWAYGTIENMKQQLDAIAASHIARIQKAREVLENSRDELREQMYINKGARQQDIDIYASFCISANEVKNKLEPQIWEIYQNIFYHLDEVQNLLEQLVPKEEE